MSEVVDGLEDGVIKDPAAVLAALQRAKDDAKRYREAFEAKETENKTLTDKVTALEGDEGIALWKKRAITTSAKSQLSQAGIKDADRVIDFMDLSKVDMTDDGKLSGWDDSFGDVKKKLPELFDPKRRVGGQANMHDHGDVNTQKTVTEMQVDKLFATS